MPTPAPTPTPIPAPANPGPDANAEAEANAQRSRSPSRSHTPLPRPYQALTTQVTDTVVLNAGAGLYVCGKAASVKEDCDMARAAVEAGTPMQTLKSGWPPARLLEMGRTAGARCGRSWVLGYWEGGGCAVRGRVRRALVSVAQWPVVRSKLWRRVWCKSKCCLRVSRVSISFRHWCDTRHGQHTATAQDTRVSSGVWTPSLVQVCVLRAAAWVVGGGGCIIKGLSIRGQWRVTTSRQIAFPLHEDCKMRS